MKRSVSILLLGALALITSCSEEKVDPILGKWIRTVESENQGPEQFIMFSKDDAGAKFTEYGWYEDTITGSWERIDDTLRLTYVAPESFVIDSVVVNNSPNGSSTSFYEGDHLVSQSVDGNISAEARTEIIFISLNESNMSFPYNGNRMDYEKQVKVARSLSFVSVLRGIFGMAFLIGLTFLFSGNKKKIDWGLVIKGTALQVIIALLVLKVPFIESGFKVVSDGFVQLISYTDDGVNFLFGQMGLKELTVQAPLVTFAVKVLPTIIFFSALMSIFYYLGVVQKIVYVFAWVMKKFMRLSGAESLAAAGNVFLGQTESPLLVKPYLMGMTKSELMCLMTGGMATIAGGVLAAYVFFLGGDDPVERAFFAKHLLTASIISAPAAVVAAKILVPETEEINKDLTISKEKIGTNILEAISNGTSDGLRLAVNVGAMLLVFIALMALGNGILDWLGDITNLNASIASNTPYSGLSFQFILGYIGAPIVWMIGVDATDMVLVGELLGQKTILNEFIAYPRLGELKAAGAISEKSVIISTYMLCGFANFASIGIQIGGIGALAPTRKGLLSQLGMKALLGGTIACLMTAAIVGMMY